MSLPIKDTPILYGKESDRFLKEVKENENKKIPEKDYRRASIIYKKVMSKLKSI